MRKLLKLFRALSDANRIRILKMLQHGPLCVCEVTAVLQLANSTVSKHLSILRDADLILDKKEGKWVNYHLNRSSEAMYVNAILPLLADWLPDDATVVQDAERVKSVDRNQICS